MTYGSSDSDGFGYDPNTGQMKSYSFAVNGATDAGSLTWNANGTLGGFSITDGISGTTDTQSCAFTYDDLARTSGINCGAKGSQSFSYDPFGNISKAANGLGLSFQPTSYNAANQPVVSGMSFDADGNTKTDNLANQYGWDPNWGTMSSLNTVTAVSDAFGQVVELDNGSSYAEIVYSPLGKTAIMSGSTLTKAFVPLPGGGAAVYNSSGILYYRHGDWLGSSRLASTPSRTLYSSTAYAPFGEPYLSSGNSDPSFTGQNQDTISSLYDFAFRRLSPSQGRWISPDPSGIAAVDPTTPQTWNRYAYVANNPLLLIDPLGLNLGHPGSCTAANSCPGGNGNDPSFSFSPNDPVVVDPSNSSYFDSIAEGEDPRWPIIVYSQYDPSYEIASNGAGPVPPSKPPQPQKKPCKATTRIGGVIKAADGYITASAMANLAALGYYGSFFIVGAMCAPEPGVFVTCPAGLFAGGSLAGSATVMGYGAYKVATGGDDPRY